jgi:hypothetical protein
MRTTSKRQRKTGRHLAQPSLFQGDNPIPGAMNFDVLLRAAISEGIRKSGKDRFDICAGMSKLTGIEVSKHGLDSWSAESRAKSGDSQDFSGNKRWGIPAELIPAFCQVTGYWEPLHIIVEAGNFKAIQGNDVVREEIARLDEKIIKFISHKKRLEKELTRAGR